MTLVVHIFGLLRDCRPGANESHANETGAHPSSFGRRCFNISKVAAAAAAAVAVAAEAASAARALIG